MKLDEVYEIMAIMGITLMILGTIGLFIGFWLFALCIVGGLIAVMTAGLGVNNE